MTDNDIELIKNSIRNVPDFPKPGIQFKDISTLLSDPVAFDCAVKAMEELARRTGFSKIAACESRGFVFGSAMAHDMHVPLVMVRKKGKLPGETVSQEYELEYGTDSIEVTRQSLCKGDKVLVVDDLVATGGTAIATCSLVEKCGAEVAGVVCLVELPDLGGSETISKKHPFSAVVKYSGK